MLKAMTIIDKLAVVYGQQGSGSDVLLLHGWADDHRTFADLTSSLAKHYRVTALDLPGFGATDPPKTAWDLTNYAEFINHFCKKLSISPKLVVGHSNGGALAIHAISTGQLQADQLVLLSSSGVRDTEKLKRLGLNAIAKTGKLATFWLPEPAKKKLQKQLYGVVGSDMLVAPHLMETFKRTVRQDIQEDAKKLDLPTLLIYGTKDRATPIKDGLLLHSLIKNSTFKKVENAGHFIHHDAAKIVANAIGDFLK